MLGVGAEDCVGTFEVHVQEVIGFSIVRLSEHVAVRKVHADHSISDLHNSPKVAPRFASNFVHKVVLLAHFHLCDCGLQEVWELFEVLLSECRDRLAVAFQKARGFGGLPGNIIYNLLGFLFVGHLQPASNKFNSTGLDKLPLGGAKFHLKVQLQAARFPIGNSKCST